MGGNETTKRRKVTEPKTSSTAAKALAAAGAAKVKPEAVPAPCPEVQIASDAAPAPPEQVPAPATPTATAIASGAPATSAPNQALEQEDLAALAAMKAQPQASTPATPLPSHHGSQHRRQHRFCALAGPMAPRLCTDTAKSPPWNLQLRPMPKMGHLSQNTLTPVTQSISSCFSRKEANPPQL